MEFYFKNNRNGAISKIDQKIAISMQAKGKGVIVTENEYLASKEATKIGVAKITASAKERGAFEMSKNEESISKLMKENVKAQDVFAENLENQKKLLY
jgi:hypothetical protein